MTRNELLNLNQYIASAGFPSLGKWDRARLDDVYVVKGSVARTTPVDITIVCDLSSDLHFLQPHGNYSEQYMPTPDIAGKRTKLVITVQRPSTDPDFSSDYTLGIERLLALQDDVAKTLERRYLIVNGDQLRLNFNLFEPKVRLIILSFAPSMMCLTFFLVGSRREISRSRR